MASFEFFEEDHSDSNGQARFTVFGVGGAGGNAVQHMLQSDIQGVKFVCANTDKQADRKSTRLNSSHVRISYAVFCLKKKNACILRVSTALARRLARCMLSPCRTGVRSMCERILSAPPGRTRLAPTARTPIPRPPEHS